MSKPLDTSELGPIKVMPDQPPFTHAGKQVFKHGEHFADGANERSAEEIVSGLNKVYRQARVKQRGTRLARIAEACGTSYEER